MEMPRVYWWYFLAFAVLALANVGTDLSTAGLTLQTEVSVLGGLAMLVAAAVAITRATVTQRDERSSRLLYVAVFGLVLYAAGFVA